MVLEYFRLATLPNLRIFVKLPPYPNGNNFKDVFESLAKQSPKSGEKLILDLNLQTFAEW